MDKKAMSAGLKKEEFEFRLLGPFEAWHSGVRLTGEVWGRQQTLKLLKLFLIERGRVYSIDQLIEAIYPDGEPGQAARNIQRRISELRRILEPGIEKGTGSQYILTTGQNNYSLSKEAACSIDTEEFERLFESGEAAAKAHRWPIALDSFERAIQLYRGDLLTEDLYEDWTSQPRANFREFYLAAILGLAESRARLGQFDRAIEACKSGLATAQSHEPLYRKLMLFQFLAGSADDAEKTYQICVKTLDEEMGIQPATDTQLLMKEIRAGAVPSAAEYSKQTQTSGHHLPQRLSSFIGRSRELEEIKELVFSKRLVTLTGAGGIGKTRLSIEAATLCTSRFPHGVWFIELAATEGDGVIRAITTRLGLKEQSKKSLLETLIGDLKEKNTLLIFDNCEHIIEPCAEAAKKLLEHCPALSILSTSRERLNLDGEVLYPLSPLAVPPESLVNHAELTLYDAIALFAERAKSGNPAFELTDQNSAAVAEICRVLDGIPLALELAAARVSMMPPRVLLERLEDRFRYLVSGKRNVLPHHQTLKSAIDWSFNLLSEHEKRLLSRLSIFRSGFSLEAVEAICIDDESKKSDPLSDLTALVQKSLVEVVREPDEARFRLLETVRQYGAEILTEADEVDQISENHQAYFLGFAERAEPELTGANQANWLKKINHDHDNFRAALVYCLSLKKRTAALRLCAALGRFWLIRGHLTEGRVWLSRALSDDGKAVPLQIEAKALLWAGMLARLQGSYEDAKSALDKSLGRSQSANDKTGEANALYELGVVSRFLGDLESGWNLLDQSLSIFRALGDKQSTARSLHQIAIIGRHRKDWELANSASQESLQISRAINDVHATAMALNTLAGVALDQMNFQAARVSFQESLKLFQQIDDKRGVAIATGNLGILTLEEGNSSSARGQLIKSLQLFRELGDRQLIAYALSVMARLFMLEGQPEPAASLQGYVTALLKDLNAPLQPDERKKFEVAAGKLINTLGKENYQRAFDSGGDLTLNEAIEMATGTNSQIQDF